MTDDQVEVAVAIEVGRRDARAACVIEVVVEVELLEPSCLKLMKQPTASAGVVGA